MEAPVVDDVHLSGDTVRINIWRSSVPVIIECQGTQLSLDVPRLSFLILAYDKIRETSNLAQDQSFSLITTVADGGNDGSNKEIINTHLPAGFLYDLYVSSGPWKLTVSIDHPQVSTNSMETLKASLWNNLKQNECIRNSSTRRIQNLTPVQSLAFSRSMLDLDFLTYWSVGSKFMTVQPDKVRHYPVRVYFNQTSVVQDLIPPRLDGAKTTVRSMLLRIVPTVAVFGPTVLDVVIHGTTVDWDLELGELLDEAQYVDGWLYIVIRLAHSLQARKEREDEEKDEEHKRQAQEAEQESKRDIVMQQTFQQLST